MHGLTCVHNMDETNVGDWNCSPGQYLFTGAKRINVYTEISGLKSVILGGGGILNDFYGKYIRPTTEKNKTIIWGAGCNQTDTAKAAYPGWIANAVLRGIRDFPAPPNSSYVPCPSCLSPIFDLDFTPQHDIVAYRHYALPMILPVTTPTLSNFGTNLFEHVQFLASGRTIITNSYHGAFWGALLGRNVILWKPQSSKFFHFKYPPMLAETSEELFEKLRKPKLTFSGFTQECREANLMFCRQVLERT